MRSHAPELPPRRPADSPQAWGSGRREVERRLGGFHVHTVEPRRSVGATLLLLPFVAASFALQAAWALTRLPTRAARFLLRGPRFAGAGAVIAIAVLVSLGLAERAGHGPLLSSGSALRPALVSVISGRGESRELDRIVEGTQVRARFARAIQTISIADEDIVRSQVLNTRELLLSGGEIGTTTLHMGFEDGSTEMYRLQVEPDLEVLRDALAHVDSRIEARMAPNLNAIVLEGTVRTEGMKRTAETAARGYLEAGASKDSARPAVLTMLDVDEPTPSMAQRVEQAIRDIGPSARRVGVRLIESEGCGVLVLEGRVADQKTLTRALSIASAVFQEQCAENQDEELLVFDELGRVTQSRRVPRNRSLADTLRVVGDESGAIQRGSLTGNGNSGSQGIQSLLGGSSSSGGGLDNDLTANVARATVLELGGGRILSFLEVETLPQVRIEIRLFEVDRRALLDWNSKFVVANSDFDQNPLLPANGSVAIQGPPVFTGTPPTQVFGAPRVGAYSQTDVQNVFSFLGGQLENQFQVSGSNWAIDTALSLLETEGIVRTLASPSLSVLSGEEAHFQVGGQVPTPINATTDAGNTLLQGTQFVSFGIRLSVKPLVGEDGFVTIDVRPEISAPDANLTSNIRASTGTALQTTAFSTRSLRTSARLADGRTLVIGGLTERRRDDTSSHTPGLADIPLIGKLFQSTSYEDQSRELVFVITPVVLRDPIPEAALWVWPDLDESIGALLPVTQPGSDTGAGVVR